MSKLPFILGGAVGFVLGARAGRPTYEKIKDFAMGFAQSRPVQAVSQKADETVGEYARYQATRITDNVAEALKAKINSTGRAKPAPGETSMDPGYPGA